MNVLFVNYGDYTTNSLNHIGQFAAGLAARGHACLVAVPFGLDTLATIADPQFAPALFGQVLEGVARFPDGRPADIVHAWTPREAVRKFVLAYVRRTHARVVLHFEDNEDYLFAARHGLSADTLLELPETQIGSRADDVLTHPRRARLLTRACDGATVIIPTLGTFLPSDLPRITLEPGLDPAFFTELPSRAEARARLELDPQATLIAYPGSSHFANEADMRALYAAVALLNARGRKATLVRTGFDSDVFAKTVSAEQAKHVIHLGFVDRAQIPLLLAAADLLVQPGEPGPYNDFRLPSKLPEFLASGTPVVTVATNLGRELAHRQEAWITPDGAPETLAAACEAILADREFATSMGRRAQDFARKRFDLDRQTAVLEAFYCEVRASDPRPATLSRMKELDTEISLAVEALASSPDEHDTRGRAAADLVPLIRHLEGSAAQREELARVERERDTWRSRFDDVRAHALNIEKQLAASSAHAENLQRTMTAQRDHLHHLEEIGAASSAHITNLETAESAAREHIRNLETAASAAREHIRNLDGQVSALRAQEFQLTQAREAERCDAAAHADALEARIVAAEQHIHNLDGIIQATRAEHAATAAQLGAARSESEARQRAIALLQAEKASLESARDAAAAQASQLSERASRLSLQIHEIKGRLQQREHKIQTLEASFSWRVTVPLRWLRRKFLDRKRARAASPAPAQPHEIAPPAPPCSAPGLFGLPHSVDEPRGWTLSPRKHLLRGWVFHPDGNELRAIRAVINGRVVEGIYGLKRLDVAASVRGKPQAEFCGWRMDVELTESDTMLEVQALEESGVWLPFFRTGLRVGADLGPADLSRYEEWIRAFDTPTAATLESQRAAGRGAGTGPLISIVMPAFNTPERWLHRAIESVRAQTYPRWELCIANDASTLPHVRTLLDEAAAADSRIKITHRERNGHISAASNSAVAIATGDFIALLDHDDELPPYALFEVVQALAQHPQADLLYSDEDKIDEDGRRFEPYFKPDWNPDLFLGQNFLSHLSVYRSGVLREVGGFREGFEGSQDWDLALRVTDRTPTERIVHIPRVLYHWRAIPGSTALQLSEKNYPVEAARKALTDHFARAGVQARLEPVPGDHWRVVYPIPEANPLVSIIIPTRNGLHHLQRCYESIRAHTDYTPYEIIIVDNQSDDPATLRWMESVQSDRVRVLPYARPFNYSAINNAAVKQARGSVIALLNNDLEVITPGWLREMVSHACREEIGCVGAMLYYPNDTVQHAGVLLGVGGVAGHAFRDYPRGTEGVFNRARLVQDYSAVTAACLVVRRAVFEQVGGLDETDLAVAFNDIDFCLKVRQAGYRNLWTPFAELYHHESASRGADDTPEKKSRFEREIEIMLRRWGSTLTDDAAYNPNLTLERNDFSLAVPPRRAAYAGRPGIRAMSNGAVRVG